MAKKYWTVSYFIEFKMDYTKITIKVFCYLCVCVCEQIAMQKRLEVQMIAQILMIL